MGWHKPTGGSRIKMLKMLGAVGGLFLVSFLPLIIVTLKIKLIWMEKKVSLLSKEVKILEVYKLSKLSIVRSNCYRCFIFTIDPSLSQHHQRDSSIV